MYIDVCMVNTPHGIANKCRLYCAPAWSGLKAGDEIVVEDKVKGVVGAVCTLNPQANEYKVLLQAFGYTHPLTRISGVYEYKPLFYLEEE